MKGSNKERERNKKYISTTSEQQENIISTHPHPEDLFFLFIALY